MNNVYHVAEFCQQIQQNMLLTEKNWNADPAYMSR